jgi:hypothetical protein
MVPTEQWGALLESVDTIAMEPVVKFSATGNIIASQVRSRFQAY